MADYYELLGVPKDAGTADIRRAYARVARERHPDRFTDPVEKERAHELFKEATAAFNTLSNERARREYDRELAKPKASTPEEMAQEAVQQAQERIRQGDLATAAELMRQAVYHVPQEARHHALLGRVLAQDPKRAREATLALEQASRLDPTAPQPLVDLAHLFRAQGLTLRARKAAEAALLLAPADPEIAQLVSELRPDAPAQPKPEGGLLGLLRRKP